MRKVEIMSYRHRCAGKEGDLEDVSRDGGWGGGKRGRFVCKHAKCRWKGVSVFQECSYERQYNERSSNHMLYGQGKEEFQLSVPIGAQKKSGI